MDTASGSSPRGPFVSRAGLKLEHALRAFEIDVTDQVCADFGCNVGGFTDCLLQHRAKQVYAIDTGYGTLAYPLRSDLRVVVMERTNALHVEPAAMVDLVVIDLAWTPQRLALPAALRWLSETGSIITLIKPHYELSEGEKQEHLMDGRLDPKFAEDAVLARLLELMPTWGAEPIQWTPSPVTGRKSGRGKSAQAGIVGPGNVEFLAWVKPLGRRGPQALEGDHSR